MNENNQSVKKKVRISTLESYFQKKTRTQEGSTSSPIAPQVHTEDESPPQNTVPPTRERVIQFDVNSLPHDPGRRRRIIDYHTSDQEVVRREYILKGPFQPYEHNFPQTSIGDDVDVLNAASQGHDAFTNNGFRGWNRPSALVKHVGQVSSVHNKCLEKYEAKTNPKTSIQNVLNPLTSQANMEYRIRLTASLHCLKFLLVQGLAIWGHDESEKSNNQGNFRELLKWFAQRKKKVGNVVFKNAPGNSQMNSLMIQKDLINACSREKIKFIIEELGDDYFGILADESRDVSCKEQMAFCLLYVNKGGVVVERFLGVVRVMDTTTMTLKNAIYSILAEYSLSPSRIRGQGYDEASNMKGDINGLKTLIKNENQLAYYIHCFAHQLQLTLVAVSKNNVDCGWLFDILSIMMNVISGSCKRQEILKEAQAKKLAEAFDNDELKTGKGLNQELGLGRPGDTRWGSHYKLLVNVILLYPAICEVLDKIFDNPLNSNDRAKADHVSFALESFDFIFMVHMMKAIFGLANQLNIALQKKRSRYC